MNQTLPIIRRISNSFKGRIPVKDLVVHTESDEVPRVEVKLRIDGVDWIDETVKKCLKEQYAHRVNKSGELVIESQRTRSLALNMADCIDKLRSAIFRCESDINEGKYKKDLELPNIRLDAARKARQKLYEFDNSQSY